MLELDVHARPIGRVRPGDGPEATDEAPARSGTSGPPPTPAAMVDWYHPVALARTGLAILASTVFGRRADPRLLEALHAESVEYFDYAYDHDELRDELWLDYVADAGDGFDSTFAVARTVAADALALTDATGRVHATQRGRVLVFGGDLVYPVASRAAYEQRLVMPYEHALPLTRPPHPDVYAIPGNHDWYDSLASFTRRFCARRWLAGWRTQQRASYFALRLPHDWWLVGTDIQLDSDVDAEQVAYFKALAPIMGDDARIILCNAEPHWIYAKKYAELDQRYSESNLRYLEDHVFERKIAVFLSGDLHHYRHHADSLNRHKIVAGGGGAFLHPTHDADVRSLPGLAGAPPYTLKASYPDVETSRALTRNNVGAFVRNWRLGLVLGLVYLMICRALPVGLGDLGLTDLAEVANLVLCGVLRAPTALSWIGLFVALVILFTDTHSVRYRVVGGGLHAFAHLAAVFLVGWAAAWLVHRGQLPLALELLATGALVVVLGGLAGLLILAGYLVVSLNCFGRHDNEAFSSLAIPDWKNFLRLHIDHRGALRIFPIGIDRVPRTWARTSADSPLEPCDPRATPPRLIEDPIEIL